ncbi:MAG TPA: CBS domain-containing protein [Chloroflexi bacterium]|nr:CBS domain-containing protein [Chloroflexota bacterium]
MQVILTHENADFDAIASLLGASRLFPAAIPVLPRRVNRNGREFLALYGAELPFVQPDDLPRGKIRRAILVDTQGLTTLRGMGRDLQVDIIDHHPLDRELEAGWTFSGEPLGATTTLLTEEIAARSLQLTGIEATLLLLGIYEDTGALSYEGTTARDMRAAAWLMEQGARLSVVNQFLHHPLAPEQRELYEQLLEQSDTYEIEGHTILVAWAEAPDFAAEISTLAHKLRELLEPSALFVLIGLDGGQRIQLVARSTTDDIDVSAVAKHFGGGGHSRAAAALICARSLSVVREKLSAVLQEIVQPRTTVAQVMSWGVQVLSPEDTVAEAADRMRRTGHEGYPVVSEGRVIGLLTRRAVDGALQFDMTDAPVAQVMEAGCVSVSIHDSVAHLQRTMIDSGWGQIPVVDGDQIVGVVTRTDLISLWGTPPTPTQQHVVALLEQALSQPVLALVHHISQVAHKMGVVPYFVGGLVRDLLLEQPIVDVDMVIEGDAITLARRLASKLGGRVRTHKRFRTAKWLLSRPVWEHVADPDTLPKVGDDLPASIDFVTARTEFYDHPTALPQVQRSSITQDLHRRDFTINTLAIRLDPDHWGELIDFYGGEADLRNGIIRVLHSLSFVDDPTRMLRAARLESRLGFHLDPRSEALISDALPLLKRISSDRLRHELELIFGEAKPEHVLCRLEELGVLAHIHPSLHCDRWLQSKYALLRGEPRADIFRAEILGISLGTRTEDEVFDRQVWNVTSQDNFILHLALLAYRLNGEDMEKLIARLKVKRNDAEDLRLLLSLKDTLAQLGKARRPSAVYHLLRPFPARVLAMAWIATDRRRLQRHMLNYQTTWRLVEPELSGDELKALGLKPGPIFGRLLGELRDARLDGKVQTREDEEALLKKRLAAEEEDDGPNQHP